MNRDRVRPYQLLLLWAVLLLSCDITGAQEGIDWQESMREHRTLVDSMRQLAQQLAPSPWEAPLRLWEGRGPIESVGGSDFTLRIAGQVSLGVVPDLAMIGEVAFVLCQYGLVAVKTSDSSQLELLSIFNAQGAEYLDMVGETALFTTQSRLLMAVDVALPTAPRLVGTMPLPAEAAFVRADPPYAYVWHFDREEFWLVDISRLDDMHVVKTLTAPGPVFDLRAEAGYLYACVDQDVFTLRLEPDLRLEPLARGETGVASGTSTATHHGNLYVADLLGIAGFTASGGPMDVVFRYFTPGVVSQMQIVGDYIWWADMYAGLQVLSIANPMTPRLSAWAEIPGFASAIAVSGDRVCVGGQNGLYVFVITAQAPPSKTGGRASISLATVVRMIAFTSGDSNLESLSLRDHDLNCDGAVSREDAIQAVGHLYKGDRLPDCP